MLSFADIAMKSTEMKVSQAAESAKRQHEVEEAVTKPAKARSLKELIQSMSVEEIICKLSTGTEMQIALIKKFLTPEQVIALGKINESVDLDVAYEEIVEWNDDPSLEEEDEIAEQTAEEDAVIMAQLDEEAEQDDISDDEEEIILDEDGNPVDEELFDEVVESTDSDEEYIDSSDSEELYDDENYSEAVDDFAAEDTFIENVDDENSESEDYFSGDEDTEDEQYDESGIDDTTDDDFIEDTAFEEASQSFEDTGDIPNDVEEDSYEDEEESFEESFDESEEIIEASDDAFVEDEEFFEEAEETFEEDEETFEDDEETFDEESIIDEPVIQKTVSKPVPVQQSVKKPVVPVQRQTVMHKAVQKVPTQTELLQQREQELQQREQELQQRKQQLQQKEQQLQQREQQTAHKSLQIAERSRLVHQKKAPVSSEFSDDMPLVGNIKMNPKRTAMPKTTQKSQKVQHEISSNNVSSTEPKKPKSLVGEVYEPGWSLSRYLQENKGNKEARQIDVVRHYFRQSAIDKFEMSGGSIFKGYLVQ